MNKGLLGVLAVGTGLIVGVLLMPDDPGPDGPRLDVIEDTGEDGGMPAPLRPLLAVAGVLHVDGEPYVQLRPRVTTNPWELADAGALDFCQPALVACHVRLLDACRGLPDGGERRRYGRVRTKALRCPTPRPDVPDALLMRWPRGAGGAACYDVIGRGCSFVESPGTCTDETLCAESADGTQPAQAALPGCWCRDVEAGNCLRVREDGGLGANIPGGATWDGPTAGAGCVSKPCAGSPGRVARPGRRSATDGPRLE